MISPTLAGMWHLQEPKIGQQPSPQMPSSAATHNRGRRLSSLPDWNDFVTSDFSTTPDDEDACICDESSSAGMMPLPGNARCEGVALLIGCDQVLHAVLFMACVCCSAVRAEREAPAQMQVCAAGV